VQPVHIIHKSVCIGNSSNKSKLQ